MNGIVLGGSLYCRKEPSTSAAYYGRFSNGDVISVQTISGNSQWYKTSWNGSVGYVMKSYVAVADDTVKVTATNVNVRNAPNITNSSVLYMLSSPSTATVEDVTNDWVKIHPSGKAIGWINADYVEKNSSSSSGNSSGFPWSVSTDTSNSYPYSKVRGTAYIYDEANSEASHVHSYSEGTRLTVHDENANFVYVTSGEYLLRSAVDVSYCVKAPTFLFGSGTLLRGSSGWEVYTLQHYLNRYLASRRYAQTYVNGNFDDTTEINVESFQMYMNSKYNAGLDVDGKVGAQTRKWLACYVQNECN